MTNGSYRLSGGITGYGINTPSVGTPAPKVSFPESFLQQCGYGTTTGKVDIIVVQPRTLTATTGETLDLYGGSLLDVLRASAPFRKLRSLAIWITSGGDTAGLTVGDDGVIASPNQLFFGGVAMRQIVYPSGPAMLGGSPAGTTVDNTHKNVKVLNNGAVSVTYMLCLAGTSA